MYRIKILSILSGSTIPFLYIQCNYYTLKRQIYVLSLSLHYRNVLETIDRRRRNSRFFSEYLCFSFVIVLYSPLVLISFFNFSFQFSFSEFPEWVCLFQFGFLVYD